MSKNRVHPFSEPRTALALGQLPCPAGPLAQLVSAPEPLADSSSGEMAANGELAARRSGGEDDGHF